MKKKFQSNVASEIPKTKLHEPELPWKISRDDMAKAGNNDSDIKAAVSATPPFKTRAIFLVLLVAAMFIIASILLMNVATENERIHNNIENREKELALMKANLDKLAVENQTLSKNSTQLERKVGDLAAQKELFTTVIESLTKKSDDIELDNKEYTDQAGTQAARN